MACARNVGAGMQGEQDYMAADTHGYLLATRLQYFLAVTRHGSIRSAAAALGVAPSSISRVIAQFEEELGAALFERIARRLVLTAAGRVLRDHAHAGALELERAQALIRDMRGLRHGSITIGVVESVARGMLPALLSQFWARVPDINVDVKVLGSKQILAAIQDGTCDLGIAFDAPHEPARLDRLAVASLPIGVIMPPGHRLARRKRVRMADLAAERILGPDTGLTINNLLHEGRGGDPTECPRMATNSIALMADLAAQGAGIAFQTRIGVERELRERTLVFVPFHASGIKPRSLGVYVRTGLLLPAAPLLLSKLISTAFQELDQCLPDVVPGTT